jgi:hypothetical protein
MPMSETPHKSFDGDGLSPVRRSGHSKSASALQRPDSAALDYKGTEEYETTRRNARMILTLRTSL